MGPVGMNKGLIILALHLIILQLGWGAVVSKDNPTERVDSSSSPNQCPWDSTCKSIEECDSGYYRTTDLQAFNCGPIRDLESMVCCFNPTKVQEMNVEVEGSYNGTGTDALEITPAIVESYLDPEIKIDILPELKDLPKSILQETQENHKRHHVQSHEDAVGHQEDARQPLPSNYAQDIHGNPLPLPDLPQDTYQNNIPLDARRHNGRAMNRNPNDPLESEIFEDLYRQESYRREPYQQQPGQFQYQNRQFEHQNTYQRDVRDPQELNHRLLEDEMEGFLHQEHSNNDWRRNRYPPKKEHWQQSHQAPYPECPCEKGERGPPGPKGEPGEPGKIIYIPVFVSPNGHPIHQDNIGNAPPSPQYSQGGNGGPSSQHTNPFGQEFLDYANRAYQYSFPSQPQDAPPYVAHPSPTFVNYAVPVPNSMPRSQQDSSYPPNYRHGQHPNVFPQGNIVNQPSPYNIPLTTVRQKRYEMH